MERRIIDPGPFGSDRTARAWDSGTVSNDGPHSDDGRPDGYTPAFAESGAAERPAPPMGWYPDPAGSSSQRYWDGRQWTRNLRETPTPRRAHSSSAPTQHVPESLAPLQTPRRAQPASSDPRPTTDGWQGTLRWGTTEDGVPLAGWWRRVAATLIDLVLVLTIVLVCLNSQVTALVHGYNAYLDWAMQQGSVSMGTATSITTAQRFGLVDPMTTLVGAYIAAQGLYQFIMLSACAGSVGQLIMRLRVVPLGRGQDHRRMPVLRALARALAWAMIESLNEAVLILTPISYLMPLWQRRRQALHDVISGTQVVHLPADNPRE